MTPEMQARDNPTFDYRPSPDESAAEPAHHPIIIVGAGPVGMTLAIDLAQRGQPVVVLDDDNTVSVGSRAICYAKRVLEIWDRLGCADPMVDLGVIWKVGRVRFRDRLVYSFDLLPESGHKMPAFINLQQYHMEEQLLARIHQLETIDLRWRNKVVAVRRLADGAEVDVETPNGVHSLRCDWLIAADGAHSPTRKALGLDFRGQVFKDKFLIGDVIIKNADFPNERWFWFDPPFNRGQSALLHKQAGDLYRIDFQIGWEADAERESQPERVAARIRAMLGEDVDFKFEWISVYTFQCRRLDRFRHGSIFFVGDAAHQVSPFGARGANSGVQDADNLAWKLDLVIRGKAPESLLDSYDDERLYGADENLLNSTRSTDFITPKSAVSRAFRDAVLNLSERYAFARPLVNSGRLSVPCTLDASPLNTPDEDAFAGLMRPGAPAADAPVSAGGREDWFLHHIGGDFVAVLFGPRAGLAELIKVDGVPVRLVTVGEGGLEDRGGLLAKRYDARPGTVYLFRPDQHVAARWRAFDRDKLAAAVRHATARQEKTQ